MKSYLTVTLACFFLAACQPDPRTIPGYIEGEFVAIAPTSSGILQTLTVQRGETVKAGDPLFSLDLTELAAQQKSATADFHKAQAKLSDLLKGERPEELEILIQQKAQAVATLINARKDYRRIISLRKTDAISLAKRDKGKADLDKARAHVEELNAQIKAANLGARIDQITVARADLDMAQQALIRANKKLQEATPRAPVSGTIEDTYFLPGEYIPAGQAVVNLLPPEKVKVRFFVNQKILPKLHLGQAVTISCDGCASKYTAQITYIAPETEYTPPVIFSLESRDKLVFLLEAKLEKFQKNLRPGLPVDVDLGF